MNPEQKLGNNVQEKIITNESVQEVAPIEVISEEDKKAAAKEKDKKEEINNEDIAKVKEDLMRKFESSEFGEARIDNPKILDMIAEIEFCTTENKEEKEAAIRLWKESVKQQYEEVIEEYNDYPDEASNKGIYGRGGFDRFKVRNGEVYIHLGEPDPTSPRLKRAIELGMKREK